MPSERQEIVVSEYVHGERLDVFLRRCLPTISRGTLQRLMADGAIRINGQAVKPSHQPRIGEVIEIVWPEPVPSTAQAEEIPLSILYEDQDIVVVNKPAGLVVHPSSGHAEHTLVNALLHHCRGQLSGVGGVARPGIVHRLDKDTSGCMVVAKSDVPHLALAAQFALRGVQKVYDALLCGELPDASGEIEAGIARHPSHRKRMAVAAGGGREARTNYEIVQRLFMATHVHALPHTGRTHQIRVHFHHLGFPLVGDQVYGKRANRRLAEATGFNALRQMLHASRLALAHPRTGERMVFEAALPEDFQQALAALRRAG
jgi:23S rRNA pseudouridine1911/1915/1917 synthase